MQSNSYLLSSDWQGPHVTDLSTRFGGGASGSLAIRTEDPDDETTYKATGIYWGGWHDVDPMTWFAPYFSPFSLNFNKNITSQVSITSIIQQFMNSKAFSQNTPVDYCCYTTY